MKNTARFILAAVVLVPLAVACNKAAPNASTEPQGTPGDRASGIAFVDQSANVTTDRDGAKASADGVRDMGDARPGKANETGNAPRKVSAAASPILSGLAGLVEDVMIMEGAGKRA